MEEKTDKLIAELISKAMGGIDQAVEFSKAQLPDVIETLMRWKMASYGSRVATAALIMVAMIWLFRKCYGFYREDDDCILALIGMWGAPVIGIFSFTVMVNNIGHTLQLWLAPKVWLIEYASSLMKTS